MGSLSGQDESRADVARPRPRPQQARSRERLGRILTATGELVDEVGIERVSIPDVAARAGTSVGSIYRFVTTRDELFVLLAEQIGAAALDSMSSIHSPEEAKRSPDEIAGDTINGYLAFLETNPGARGLLAARSLSNEARTAMKSETLWLERIEGFLATFCPAVAPDRRPVAGALFITCVEAGLLQALTQPVGERDMVLDELKLFLSAYLEALSDAEK